MRIATTVFVLAGILFFPSAQAQSVISFAGGTLESPGMSLSFSAGEVVAGEFESSSFQLTGGFGNGFDLVYTSNEEVEMDLPAKFDLSQNYPNPFNPSTNIRFDLPVASDVKLEVYSSIGAKVAVLANDRKSAGSYTVRFDASHLASGMYFYRLIANGKTIATQKMLLIK
jgi:hypothetical protein